MQDAESTHGPSTHSTSRPRIAIVGGGTAGWMSAATLRRRLGCEVTLVESARTPAIGVGEATIPAMIDWIKNMGIDEDELLRYCHGTYKLAIRFDDWIDRGHRYWHPFGICGGTLDGIDLIHFLRRGVSEGWIDPQVGYTDFSLQKQLCEQAKALRPADGPAVAGNYAFHLDAGRLADFVREIAMRDGVTRHIAHVVGAELDNHGLIRRLHLDGRPPIEADLFLDCSGFASVLIEKQFGCEWIDWSDYLLCDRAVTMRVARTAADQRNTLPYTISSGQDAGWSWQIPLREVDGMGYVYSSRHISDEDATRRLIRCGEVAESAVDTRTVPFRVGFRPESWRANCVAIGLASGFVEPLESTGIFLVQRALDELVDSLAESTTAGQQRSRFNSRMQAAYEEIRDFVLLHYVLSQRHDTSFWRDARRVSLPDSLARSIDRYCRIGAVDLSDHHDPVFAEANHHFIFSGAHVIPPRTPQHSAVQHYRADIIAPLLQSIQATNHRLAAALPSHRQLLDSIHQPVSCA